MKLVSLNEQNAVVGRRKDGARATITDVARVSGTSIKTISRGLNDEPFVRPATRERVLEAARELDYHPNLAARSLAGRRSFLLGLFYEPPSPNSVIDLQTGSLDRLATERYRLLLFPCDTGGQTGARLAGLARASGLDGLILAPPMCDSAEITAHLSEGGFAFARIAPTRDPALSPAVGMDDVAAAADMTRHLPGLRHRRIGFVAGDPSHPSSAGRAVGFRAAMAGAGAAIDETLLVPGFYTFETGAAAARARCPAQRRVRVHDDMAAGVLMAANKARLELPAELSVVGFAALPRTTPCSPPSPHAARR